MISSTLIISHAISFIEKISLTKSIFGFNIAVVKTLSGMTFQELWQYLKNSIVLDCCQPGNHNFVLG